MPKRTPDMPSDMFNDESGAISRLTGGPNRPVRKEPEPSAAQAAPRKQKEQQRHLKQTSFYLSPEQLVKLDSLAHTHYLQTGSRINRNDIVRFLVDRCRIGDIADLES